MHAFVTGATGFIGQHLIEQLLKQGWQITALYRDANKIYECEHGSIHWQQADLCDIQSVRCAMPESVDAVFHLACDTSNWSLNHRRQYQTNVLGTQTIAKVALEKNAIRFIHTSSLAVYGFHEGDVDEYSEMRGIDSPLAYYRSKYLAEEVMREYLKKGLDVVMLNPSAVIGPRDQQNWGRMFNCINEGRLPGIPPGTKSFCYVEDVAKAHVQAFIHGKRGENYILSGPTTDLAHIYRWIAKRLQRPIPARIMPSWLLKCSGFSQSLLSHFTRKEPKLSIETAYVLCANVTACSDKAQRELQYKNTLTLEQMLEETFQWWQAQSQPNPKSSVKSAA